MGRSTLTVIAVLVLGCLGGAQWEANPAAQDGPSGDPQSPTFVTGVHVVRVDLYAMRDGRLVDDLRIEEIELYEDGVRQTIETLERIDIRPPDPLVPGLETRTLEASRRAAADPRSRVFAVFLDRWHTEYLGDHGPAVQVRFPLLRQFETILGPDDLVGVMTYDMRAEDVTFVRGLDGLARLEGTWDRYSALRPGAPGRDFDAQEELYLACYVDRVLVVAEPMIDRRRERMALDALEDLAAHLGALRDERKAVLVITDGWRLYTPDPDLIRPRRGEEPPRPPFGGPDIDRTLVISSERGASELSVEARERCEADRAALAALDHRGRVRQITARANRANVSFYPISPAGLTTALSLAPAGQARRGPAHENTTALAMQGTLRVLAADTDGLAVVHTDNVEEGIRRMDEDLSAYYLLGYTSTNSELDGRFRRITVRVHRPAVTVRARPGYLAPSALEGRAAATRRDRPEALDVASALRTMANVNLRAPVLLRSSAWTRAGAEGHAGLFWVAGELEPQARRETAWRAGAAVEITVLAPNGSTLLSRSLEAPSIGYHFQVRVPDVGRVAPGDYHVRVRLRGGDGTTLAETVRVSVAPEGTALGEPVLWRRGPGTGPQHIVTADPRFRRTERLRLEVPAASEAPATARLLDRAGTPLAIPVEVSRRADASEPFAWIVADVPLAPLAPGDYAVEVAQGEATVVTAFRIVP